MSINELTTAAAWIAGLAIIAMIASGWRKPARATADPLRARKVTPKTLGVPVEETDAPLYRRTPIWRRVWAVLAGSVMAVVVGALAATLIAFSLAWVVITLTDMLKQ